MTQWLFEWFERIRPCFEPRLSTPRAAFRLQTIRLPEGICKSEKVIYFSLHLNCNKNHVNRMERGEHCGRRMVSWIVNRLSKWFVNLLNVHDIFTIFHIHSDKELTIILDQTYLLTQTHLKNFEIIGGDQHWSKICFLSFNGLSFEFFLPVWEGRVRKSEAQRTTAFSSNCIIGCGHY